MSYYKTCPHCGAHIDPGEACDCQDKKMERAKELLSGMTSQQLEYLIEKWETALGVGSTQSGKAEQGLTDNVHASIVHA